MPCSSCHYDLTNLALPAKCPECGHWNAAPHPHSNSTPRLPGWLRLTLIAWFAAAAILPILSLAVALLFRDSSRTAFPSSAGTALGITMALGLLLAITTLIFRRWPITLAIAGALLIDIVLITSLGST